MEVYLLRHGQTNYNVKGLANALPSKKVILTPLGIKQAEKASKKLKDKKLELIFTSQLYRTLQTAEIVNSFHKLKLKQDSRLNDRKTGFEHQPVQLFKEYVEKDPLNIKPPRGESFQEEKSRVIDFLEDLKKLSYKEVLVVAHKEPIQIILAHNKNLPDNKVQSLKVGNCDLFKINVK